MRSVVIAACVLVLALLLGASPPQDKPRPQTRTIQVKSGSLVFKVRLVPGVPHPGQVVEAAMEAAEVPPVPDPVYGERIPLKQAKMTALVTDADGEGYTTGYRVHPLADAGSYGFHFTPLRREIYRVALTGTHRGVAFKAEFKVPVDMWPFPPGIDDGSGSASPAPATRMPALPASMKQPAQPATAGGTPETTRLPPLRRAMHDLGLALARAGAALELGRRPDVAEASQALGGLAGLVGAARQASAERTELATGMDQLQVRANELSSQLQGKRRAAVRKAYRSLVQGCTACHLQQRWKLGGQGELP